jgi:small subunit ribosomal protein S6
MRPYEVMVIFDTGAEPPAIQAVVDRIVETVRSSEGTPGHIDRWGRRPFAYEVKHRREGYYVLVEFSGASQTVAELNRMLTLADEVLRHKVVRLPEKAVRRLPASGPGRPAGRGGRTARGEEGQPETQPASAEPAPAEPASETAAAEPASETGPEASEREAAATGGPVAG